MAKNKLVKNLFLTLPIVGSALIIAPTVTSCSLFRTQLPPNASNLYNYMNNSSQIEWISKRSFSLKFLSDYGNVGYGTGWIFSKNPTKNNSYYIATNMHVASFIQNQGRRYYTSNNGGNSYGVKTGDVYSTIELGVVGSRDALGNFKHGTTSPYTSYGNGGFHYIGSIPTSSVKIVYSGNNLYQNTNLTTIDPFEVRGNTIENGAIDFTLLEFDFDQYRANAGYMQKAMTDLLADYDKNPTKFAQDAGEKHTNLFIGGFPYENEILNPKDPYNSSNNKPIWVGLSNVSVSQLTSGISLRVNKPNIKGVSSPYTNVAIANEIPFIQGPYSSYRNIALQGLMSGIDIGGGSSGSMVINEDYEVVGIYWGTYTLTGGNLGSVVGGLDYFYSPKSYQMNIDYKRVSCYSYNMLENVQNKIGVENLAAPIWQENN